jgi:hypothetical protein
MAYNSRTGTLAAGQRGAAANVYTGNYATGARGAATNAGTGISAATRQGTAGNVYTGNEISGGQSVYYNRNTGEVARTGHISGDEGTLVNMNGNVYAGHDGNIYRHTDDGWQELNQGSGWEPSQGQSQAREQLDRDMAARDRGGERYAGRMNTNRSMSRGGGRRR